MYTLTVVLYFNYEDYTLTYKFNDLKSCLNKLYDIANDYVWDKFKCWSVQADYVK